MRNKSIRFMAVIIIACLFLPVLGCDIDKNDTKISIISTIFPSYDFARQIICDNADLFTLTQLLPPGSESHSYEPAPRDIIALEECDLFIYVGGESDAWVERILASCDHPPKTLN